MKRVELGNGSVVLRATIIVMVTRFDLIAAVCFALAKGRRVRSKKQITRLVKTMIESVGVNGILKVMKRYSKEHAVQAEVIVSRFFPELRGDTRACLLPGKN